MTRPELDAKAINTIRFLSVDAVEKAASGHPGAPMGLAPAAYVLWDRYLKHNPRNPRWHDRDRFVLSAGHASMLIYSLLHLTGYDLSLDDIRSFRQWGSRTPGHPERGVTPGVEVTTGPLGQGISNAVGMAIAEKHLAARYNRPGHEVVDHHTYVICSDGDLMEGVSSEASSLAGTLGLGKLVCLYDDNEISIEGGTELAFREDVASRYRAYGWHVSEPVDGLDLDAIDRAVEAAREEKKRPSLIIVRTTIGYGSPKADTAGVHGSPLGTEAALETKRNLEWPEEPAFLVPEDVEKHMRQAVARGANLERSWTSRLKAYAGEHPEASNELSRRLAGELPEGWDDHLDGLFADEKGPMATRSASGRALNAIAKSVPELMGGSADLAPSNKTLLDDEEDFSAGHPEGRNLRFGVREHAMGAIASGLAAHGGVVPYTGTFLTFSDYMRPPIRLAAMMGLRVVYVFTHDSIGLGEDGPTHQSVEHVMSLRLIPGLTVVRPADADETAEAWRLALSRTDGPTALVLTRQKLSVPDRSEVAPATGASRGAYVHWQSSDSPEVILIATGSEVEIARAAGRALAADGVAARVVSMPSWEIYDAQPAGYRESVLPANVSARVSIEAGVTTGWERFVGRDGVSIGVDRFGESAPYETVYREFGLTPEAVVEAAGRLLGR
ncbi:MAG: transketolase [Candidatus Eisenbacteria bacterium]|nr:transketolase [Candidatus Eisenbacteria bacterium]